MIFRVFTDIIRGFFLGIIVFLISAIIDYSNGISIFLNWELLNTLVHTQVYTIVLFVVNANFYRWLLYRNVFQLHSYSLVFLNSLGSVLLSFFCLFFLNSAIGLMAYGTPLEEFMIHEDIKTYLVPLAIILLVSIVVSGFHFYKTRQEIKVKEQKVIAGKATAQFDALKNQLDPHFLFNSLNVLNSLIEENTEAAQKFTTLLSKVYRYVLEQKSKELVSVEEELNFASTYMKLVHMRFENSIVFEVEQNVDLKANVVPLSLQLLLENAIKHNQVKQNKPLKVNIYQKDNYLVVSNNFQPKSVIKHSSGVGLINIKQRYALLTERRVLVEKSEEDFRVRIPLLTKRIKMEHIQKVYVDNKKYLLAKKKIEDLKGFYGNLTAYLLVIPFLAWINYMTTTDFPWIVFPTVGWGLGVIFHGMEVFNYNPFLGKSWEEKKIREFMKDDN